MRRFPRVTVAEEEVKVLLHQRTFRWVPLFDSSGHAPKPIMVLWGAVADRCPRGQEGAGWTHLCAPTVCRLRNSAGKLGGHPAPGLVEGYLRVPFAKSGGLDVTNLAIGLSKDEAMGAF